MQDELVTTIIFLGLVAYLTYRWFSKQVDEVLDVCGDVPQDWLSAKDIELATGYTRWLVWIIILYVSWDEECGVRMRPNRSCDRLSAVLGMQPSRTKPRWPKEVIFFEYRPNYDELEYRAMGKNSLIQFILPD